PPHRVQYRVGKTSKESHKKGAGTWFSPAGGIGVPPRLFQSLSGVFVSLTAIAKNRFRRPGPQQSRHQPAAPGQWRLISKVKRVAIQGRVACQGFPAKENERGVPVI